MSRGIKRVRSNIYQNIQVLPLYATIRSVYIPSIYREHLKDHETLKIGNLFIEEEKRDKKSGKN